MSLPTREQVMKVAAAEIGYTDNSGARYWKFVYPAWIGGAFCACFEAYCFKKCGGNPPAPGITGMFYTPTLRAKAIANGTFRAPTASNASKMKYGDIVTYDWNDDGTTDHTSFFEKYLGNGYFQTIESNTSSGSTGSQSNGRGTWRRSRHVRDVSAFIDASYLYADGGHQDLEVGLSLATRKRIQQILGVQQDGVFGQKTISTWQSKLHTVADGIVDEGGSPFVRAIQTYLNNTRNVIIHGGKVVAPAWASLTVDGEWGPRTAAAVTEYIMNWNGGFTS